MHHVCTYTRTLFIQCCPSFCLTLLAECCFCFCVHRVFFCVVATGPCFARGMHAASAQHPPPLHLTKTRDELQQLYQHTTNMIASLEKENAELKRFTRDYSNTSFSCVTSSFSRVEPVGRHWGSKQCPHEQTFSRTFCLSHVDIRGTFYRRLLALLQRGTDKIYIHSIHAGLQQAQQYKNEARATGNQTVCHAQ